MSTDRVAARRARVRARIVAAAWEVAADAGLEGLTLTAIADRVGMRAPSLYEYFTSKAAILDALFADGYRQMAEQVVAPMIAAMPDPPTRESLVEGARRSLEFMTADLARYQVMFTRVVPGWDPSPPAYEASIAVYEQMEQAMAAFGLTEPDDVDLFTAMTAGLAAQQYANDPGGSRYLRLTERAVDAVLAVTRSTVP
jgi:AcrR family transcriptional regulator